MTPEGKKWAVNQLMPMPPRIAALSAKKKPLPGTDELGYGLPIVHMEDTQKSKTLTFGDTEPHLPGEAQS